jgi:predicted metalloprotease with PDZ domain
MSKFHIAGLALLAALAVPGAVRAQEDEEGRRPGMIGVVFDTDDDSEDGVRILEVRRGSPADRAGVEEGDVVIRLDGRDAEDAVEGLSGRLHAGDTVRLHLRRGRDVRDVAVVAAPRPSTRVSMMRAGRGEPVIIVNGDSIEVPLQALTMRIDSLHTRLLNLDGDVVRVQMDSLVRMFRDSAGVMIERMPNFEVHIDGPDIEALRLEDLEDLAELNAESFHFDAEDFDIDTEVFGVEPGEQPFFLELGRRAAAGAELAEMNEGLSRYFGNVRTGALVIDVAANTPAARAGLEAGDVIVRAGGRDVNGPQDVRRALTRADDGRVALEVLRQGRRRELSMEWRNADRVIRREMAPARARARVRVQPRVAPDPDN